MLLALFFLSHLAVTFANPFHKYPYVFLLDVGNEELQTNSEQIRVSIPGGSLALRYPAIGEGDNIAHVRVSGIDFGTDLKASIVDGGPGYKYVVIVFMGNPESAYDAVVTVSTLNNDNDIENGDADSKQTKDLKTSSRHQAGEGIIEDNNDSAEVQELKSDESVEQVPSASNFYDSAENADTNGKEEVNNEDDSNAQDEENTYESYKENIEEKDYADPEDQQEDQDYEENDSPNVEKYRANAEHNSEQNNEALEEVDRKLYEKYNGLRPRLYDDVKVNPQEVNEAENEVDNDGDEEVYSPEDPIELDQMFNDEEVHNDGEKYTDSNNNNYGNADDSSAVAY